MTRKQVAAFSLKEAPSLIERALSVQRLSAEAYKEQEGRQSKTLTPLGNYWKGRKPLILNKGCILGCLLPATDDLAEDLRIFELLMGMDDVSLSKRLGLDGPEELPPRSFREHVYHSRRAEQLPSSVHDHIWGDVNKHLGTDASSFPELMEQLGIMRFGHRPRVADTFSGSGQIPYEAARLGCDVEASDLNPVACMLTWGAFNIIGGDIKARSSLENAQAKLLAEVRAEVDKLEIEQDGKEWRAKVFLYCVETTCPETGWQVPLLPSRIISKGRRTIAVLVPDAKNKRYGIEVRNGVSAKELADAAEGTLRTDGRGQDPYLIHSVRGTEYRTKISTLRGDKKGSDGATTNRLRRWKVDDFMPREDDILRERLYAIQWIRTGTSGREEDAEFRAVTDRDLAREAKVVKLVKSKLASWQASGIVPDMPIESGAKTDEPIRTRGWTYWHHLFNPRQLLIAALINERTNGMLKFALTQVLNINARLSRFDNSEGGAAATKGVFDNQALNPLFNYGCRATSFLESAIAQKYPSQPLPAGPARAIHSQPASQFSGAADIFITDPPYGDAVKYEEILEFFIAWLRKHPPPEFAEWTWDSRRALAIKGEGEDFRREMVAAYKRMAEAMPDNGIQVIMFTHQSGAIWADMANIVWAAGLRVTAAWYVATETDSALRDGSHVKGTVLLVVRKRKEALRTTRDELAWELKDEVEAQVSTLTGLNQKVKIRLRDENLFEDADLQMAGYAAALRVLTQFAVIDGKDMTAEAIRPRVKGERTVVDELIEYAVGVANQALVPTGLDRSHWDRLRPVERFYLKMLELESKGAKSLDNYQNFAKAFKVQDFKALLASHKANDSRLLTPMEIGKREMSDGSELAGSPLRGVLYAVMELCKEVDGADVLTHLSHNLERFYDPTTRVLLVALADYLAAHLGNHSKADEKGAARVLGQLIANQKL